MNSKLRGAARLLGLAILAGGLATSLQAQKPPAPPAPTPINPALANLEITLTGLNSPGFALAGSDALGTLAASCENGSIVYWEKDMLAPERTGERTAVVWKGHQGPVTGLAWNGGPVLASAGIDQKIILWAVPGGKPINTISAGAALRALAMSPDGKRLAAGGDDSAVQLIDVAGAKVTAKLPGHTDWVLALAFNADGKRLASAGYDGTARIWDVDAGKKLLDIPILAGPPPKPPKPPLAPEPEPAPIAAHAVAFSADGKLLAVGGADGQIYLFNPADGKLVRAIPGHTSAVTALVFHPNNTLLISGSKDRTVRLWNVADGKSLKVLDGHTAWVEGVTLRDQGNRVASVAADQTVKLWSLKEAPKKK